MICTNINEVLNKISDNKKVLSILLYIYTCFLGILNLLRCFDNALWMDEAASAIIARYSIREIIGEAASDVHPPLYYIILHFFRAILGESGFMYHFTSLVPYLVLLLLGLSYIRKRFGNITSVIFVTMISLMGRTLKYNIEVRMYSWACLLVFLTFIILYEILSFNKTKDYLLFMLCAVISAYLHLFALLAVGYLYLALWLWVLIKKDRERIVKTLLITIGAIILYSPWVVTMLKSFMRVSGGGFWITYIPSFKQCYQFFFGFIATFPVVLFFLVVFFAYETKSVEIIETNQIKRISPNIKIVTEKPSQFPYNAYFVLTGIFTINLVCVTGTVVSHIFVPLFVERYLFPVTAIAYLVFGITVSKTKFRHIYCVGITIVVLIAGMMVYTKIYKEDKALDVATGQFLENVVLGESDYVITNIWNIMDYYYPETTRVRLNGADFDPDEWESYENVWILWPGTLSKEVSDNLNDLGYYAELYYQGILGEPYTVYLYNITKE